MTRDRLSHFIKVDGKTLCFDDKLFDLTVKKLGSLGGGRTAKRRNDSADARPRLKQSVIDQLGDHFMGCIWIDTKLLGERSNGRKWIALAELAGYDGPRRSVYGLFIDGNPGSIHQAKGDHACTITRSTQPSKTKSHKPSAEWRAAYPTTIFAVTRERWAQIGITTQFLIVVRTLGEIFRLRHIDGAAFSAADAMPYVGGALIAGCLCWIGVTLYFFRKYTLSAWIALATVVILLVYKIAVIGW